MSQAVIVNHKERLLEKLQNRTAKIGIVGLGYVGLPLAVAFAEEGFQVMGVDLSQREAKDVMANIHFIWTRPVHLQTIVDETPTLLSFDGSDHSVSELGEDDDPRRDDT